MARSTRALQGGLGQVHPVGRFFLVSFDFGFPEFGRRGHAIALPDQIPSIFLGAGQTLVGFIQVWVQSERLPVAPNGGGEITPPIPVLSSGGVYVSEIGCDVQSRLRVLPGPP